MEQSTKSVTESTASVCQSIGRKRGRSSAKTEHNGNGNSAFAGESVDDDSQKEPEEGVDYSSIHKRKQMHPSSDIDVSRMQDMKLKGLRLEAIFHPKFENESSEKDVRAEMLSRVGSGEGYLEVTLKHSGSLLLWSGGSRFYSKNDTNNIVTLVGEFLLRRHMELVWGESSIANKKDSISKYCECSDHLQENRITLAFEVVTSVLGDHGDTPKHPYLILLSVADRKTQQFYTSQQLIELAQRFRLPHNDYWMFASQSSCKKLFQFYDDIREMGTAESVIKGLDQLIQYSTATESRQSKCRIFSMYPHLEYQGNILEGLVVRFIAGTPTKFDASDDNSKIVLHPRSALTDKESTEDCLRNCFDDTHDASESERKIRNFLRQESAQNAQQGLVRKRGIGKEGSWDIQSFISSLLAENGITDIETKQIIELIRILKALGVKIDYKLYTQHKQDECSSSNNQRIKEARQRWICIIHVIHDETFKKYRRVHKRSNTIPLFRGFSFELVSDDSNESILNHANLIKNSNAETDVFKHDVPLMLKMKFLPYMARTFGCRNGLKLISQSGISSYERYTLDLLNKLGISHSSIKTWQPFFYNWGLYAESVLRKQKQNGDVALGHRLNEHMYLRHLSSFEALYHRGEFPVTDDDAKKSKFLGLIIVLSLDEEYSSALGCFLSEKLRIQSRFKTTDSISEIEMLSSLCGDGAVCNAIVSDPQTPIRKLIKNEKYADAIYVILYGCSQEEINHHHEEGSDDHKRISGMTNAWSRLRCKKVIHLPKVSSSIEESKEAADVVSLLTEESRSDEVEDKCPGLLVFFPSIPGCGKSSICGGSNANAESFIKQFITEDLDSHQSSQPVVICEGDKVKGKYWQQVLLNKIKESGSIYLADKNATPNVWSVIGEICSKSNNVAVSVLPDRMALSTVTVRHSDQLFCYPYSLAYLAICMLRVLKRPSKTHTGKLDESTEDAMLVVVKFYTLYRGISAENLQSIINQKTTISPWNIHDTTITVPFFTETKYKELPPELSDCLIDALQLQFSIDRKDIISKEDRSSMERRLRAMISQHESFLESLCNAEFESRSAFFKQLSYLSSSLTKRETARHVHSTGHKFIEIVSIDIDRDIIDRVLEEIRKDCVQVEHLMMRIGKKHSNKGTLNLNQISEGTSVEKTHVTMAHFSQLSQQDILKGFAHVEGRPVTVTITDILIGESIAAFRVKLPKVLDDLRVMPSCLNVFPHVTIWFGSNESAAKSNDLPAMVERKEAIQVELSHQSIAGTFCFWYI